MIDFIINNKELVHPKVIKMVEHKNSEGINMALNHIHYGTLKTTRKIKDLRSVIPLVVDGCRDAHGTNKYPIANDEKRDLQHAIDTNKYINNKVQLETDFLWLKCTFGG